MKKLTQPKEKPYIKSKEEKDIENIILDCISKGQEYRNIFKPTWDEIEAQIRQQPPDSWKNKEDWQTKIFIPLQAGGSETGFSKFKKILFSSSKIIDIIGVDKDDKKRVGALLDLFQSVTGTPFEIENDNVLAEGVDYGSALLKVLASPNPKDRTKDKISYTWRSAYNCGVDPSCGNNFSKAKWWWDEYKKDLGDLVGNPGNYNKTVIAQMLKDASNQPTIDPKTKADIDLVAIRSIDGTSDVRIPSAWKNIVLYEWWGLMKVAVKKEDTQNKTLEDITNYTDEWRVITLATMGDKNYILRNDKNEYGRIPAVMLTLKLRKFEVYGRGYLENGRGLQELDNSMVNLGFDSEKLNSFDIAIIDVNKVSDWSSIKREPNALWRMNDINGVKLGNKVQSALVDIVTRALPFIDQMYQDATKLTRHSQGTSPILGGGGDETLGEYKLKMEAVDETFLAQAKIVESRYAKPLFSLIYSILVNPKLFSQLACDKLLGMDAITEDIPAIDTMTGQPILDPNTQQPVMTQQINEVSKLILADLDKDAEVDFRLIGVTQLQQIIQVNEQITKIITLVSQMPVFMQYLKPEGLLRQFVNSMRVQDSDEIVKSEEEVAKDKQEAEQGTIAQLQMEIQQLMQVIQQAGIKLPAQTGGGQP